MKYLWKETTYAVFLVICQQHEKELVNHRSVGDLLNTWIFGFKDSKYPLVKSSINNVNGWQYFIFLGIEG